MDPRRRFGNQGEALASEFLQKLGYQILYRQYRTRGGEIDLVCRHGEEVVFVEVKTRSTAVFGYPEESVTPKKIARMRFTAEQYLQEYQLFDVVWRFDVISVLFDKEPPRVDHFINIDIPDGF